MAEKAPNKGTKARGTAKTPAAKTEKKVSVAKAGSKKGKKKTSFKLHAPEASQVYVAGCFNNWDVTANPLQRNDEGTWACTLLLDPGRYEYRFVVDGVWWDDPLATMRCANEFGCENCVIIV